ncbi:hypothetical protein L1887_47915 [Cichorium endivia]|nr:hypothetical protein L1887_47915 [Cichorium endivia]
MAAERESCADRSGVWKGRAGCKNGLAIRCWVQRQGVGCLSSLGDLGLPCGLLAANKGAMLAFVAQCASGREGCAYDLWLGGVVRLEATACAGDVFARRLYRAEVNVSFMLSDGENEEVGERTPRVPERVDLRSVELVVCRIVDPSVPQRELVVVLVELVAIPVRPQYRHGSVQLWVGRDAGRGEVGWR